MISMFGGNLVDITVPAIFLAQKQALLEMASLLLSNEISLKIGQAGNPNKNG